MLLLLNVGAIMSCSKSSTSPVPDNDLIEYVTPEEVGYSTEALDEVRAVAEQGSFAAIMALYDGKVFFHWGDISRNFKCHSIRKPFMSALYGIHVARGHINLDDTLAELGIDDIPPSLTNEEKLATVRDLLRSRSGVYHEAAAETDEMKELRPERGSHPPGSFFYYNNWDFNALGTIFGQETETEIFEEFEREIADPLGMEDFSSDDCYYQYEEDLSMHPAYSFRMSARDMARFGVLYQKNGMWGGNEIISGEWITETTSTFSVLDSTSGVGYGHMWMTIPESSVLGQMAGSSGYFHTGVGIHVLMIIPEQKLVIVQRYDTDGAWVDPGDVGMELGLMIVNARITG
jgi:CubicO group peptidase (beta-lactamase class C family)